METHLTIKHLAPYLPYELKVNLTRRMFERENVRLIGSAFLHNDNTNEYFIVKEGVTYGLEHIKPILRPLSDLTKEIEYNGEKFVPVDAIRKILIKIDGYSGDFKYEGYEYQAHRFKFEGRSPAILGLPYHIVEKLFEWHFDVFNLREKNLCVYYDELTNPTVK